jgi:hypothetical protein
MSTPIAEQSVSDIRRQAKGTISGALVNASPAAIVFIAEKRFQEAQDFDRQGQLRAAFFKYQQGAKYTCMQDSTCLDLISDFLSVF